MQAKRKIELSAAAAALALLVTASAAFGQGWAPGGGGSQRARDGGGEDVGGLLNNILGETQGAGLTVVAIGLVITALSAMFRNSFKTLLIGGLLTVLALMFVNGSAMEILDNTSKSLAGTDRDR